MDKEYIEPKFKSQYFNDDEILCRCCKTGYADEQLLLIMDKTRKFINKPIYILSWFRCPKHNLSVGSNTNNHLYGKAVDINCSTGLLREELIKTLLMYGVKRFVIHNGSIHIDINNDKPHGIFLHKDLK